MNAFRQTSIVMLIGGLLCASALAQPGPEGGPPEGGPHRMDKGDRRPPPPRGEMDFDGPREGVKEPPEMAFVRLFRGYLELVRQVTELADDPSATGVSAVLTASDILKARSNSEAISFFTEILPQVKDPTVRRAIQLQLVDLYKNSNQHDKALTELRGLIVPAGE